ncbi:hypothetical protein G7Y89_g929 [Cudoniella acicularis]|uniref:Uncharacterized protein n=1 Tax=Cudoniella acicularis TaxID=354080 RepID=A0A8H4WAR2_9HELO|nr:hypothetical protein G7Y89_g929 [Cudoniella acicularis]
MMTSLYTPLPTKPSSVLLSQIGTEEEIRSFFIKGCKNGSTGAFLNSFLGRLQGEVEEISRRYEQNNARLVKLETKMAVDKEELAEAMKNGADLAARVAQLEQDLSKQASVHEAASKTGHFVLNKHLENWIGNAALDSIGIPTFDFRLSTLAHLSGLRCHDYHNIVKMIESWKPKEILGTMELTDGSLELAVLKSSFQRLEKHLLEMCPGYRLKRFDPLECYENDAMVSQYIRIDGFREWVENVKQEHSAEQGVEHGLLIILATIEYEDVLMTFEPFDLNASIDFSGVRENNENNVKYVKVTYMCAEQSSRRFRRVYLTKMEDNYILNPAIKLYAEHVEPGSQEKEVQVLWENLLWTVFPAHDHWSVQTKHKSEATEPDNKVTKIIEYTAGWSSIDALIVELKRPRGKTTQKDFNDVLNSQLDDHIALSSNPSNSVLFGAVGIGLHIQFYSRMLPRGRIHTCHSRPYHLIEDASSVQEIFDNIKCNVTQGLYVLGLATEELEISAAPQDPSTSYVTASSSLAPESSTNPAPDASTS